MTLYEKTLSLKDGLNKIIVGQETLIERLLIALFADGHLLVQGAPGLAKTKAINALSTFIDGDFHRIQFTPDLLPADITGTDIFHQETGQFSFQPGPIFHNIVLADEINRAPAKVQSALLEAMAERQISVGKKTYKLPKLFLVMATQNPIEQEGTYNLPEAQLDRFMLQVNIDYPDKETEKEILRLNRLEFDSNKKNTALLSQNDIFAIRDEIKKVHTDESLENYIVELVMATRNPSTISEDLKKYIEYGVSPRGSIFLDRASKTLAWLRNKDYVSPSEITDLVHEVFRHRIGPSFLATSKNLTSDKIIDEILMRVPLP